MFLCRVSSAFRCRWLSCYIILRRRKVSIKTWRQSHHTITPVITTRLLPVCSSIRIHLDPLTHTCRTVIMQLMGSQTKVLAIYWNCWFLVLTSAGHFSSVAVVVNDVINRSSVLPLTHRLVIEVTGWEDSCLEDLVSRLRSRGTASGPALGQSVLIKQHYRDRREGPHQGSAEGACLLPFISKFLALHGNLAFICQQATPSPEICFAGAWLVVSMELYRNEVCRGFD